MALATVGALHGHAFTLEAPFTRGTRVFVCRVGEGAVGAFRWGVGVVKVLVVAKSLTFLAFGAAGVFKKRVEVAEYIEHWK
jgi:hypothetical protein